MLKWIVIGCVMVLSLSCEVRFDWPWLKEKPAASSTPAAANRTVGAFTKIRLEGAGQLVLDDQLPAGQIQIEVDPQVLKQIQTEVVDSTLILRETSADSPLAFRHLKYRVGRPNQLTELTLAGLGSIECLGTLQVPNLVVRLTGMGKISARVQATKIELSQSGQGELQVQGQAERVSITADGLGRIDAQNLVGKTVSVTSSGLGEILVHATTALTIQAKGVGSVSYRGHPAQTDFHTEGLGKIHALD